MKRLQANKGTTNGHGRRPGDGLLLCLWPPVQHWDIALGDAKDYYLTGTFTISMPADYVPKDFDETRAIWTGTLEFPRVKIALQKP
jgi:hypothetical protein